MNPILTEAKKYFKYAKLLLNELAVAGTEGNTTFPVDIMKNHKNKMSNYRSTICKLDNGLDSNAILKYVFCKNIAAFARMIEAGNFHDDSDHVTVDTISAGMDLNVDREYMIFPEINISLTYVWCTSTPELCAKIAEYYDHLFFHAIEFVSLVGGSEVFIDVNVGYLQHSSKIYGACEMARYVIDQAVDKCEEVEDKDGAKNASKILFQSLSSGAADAGLTSPSDFDPEKMISKPETIGAIKSMQTTLQSKLDNKEVTKSQILDATCGICDIGEKEFDKMTPEAQRGIKTLAVCFKEKMNTPEIKNNPQALKFCRIFVSRFNKKDVETDQDLLKKLRKKRGMDVIKDLM